MIPSACAASPSSPSGGSGVALRSAAAGGDVSAVERFLGSRRQVRFARDELGRTALHLAASAGHVPVVRTLLQAAAHRELDAADAAGCTALQRAAADGHEVVVKLLIDNGALLDKQDSVHGNTALHEASWKGYSRTVAILAGAGANLLLTNSGGFTALHLCCQNGHNQSCRELLLAGCDPDLQNNYGDTSLHTAARYGHAGVTRILISAQCRVSDQNKNGDTALHIAAAMGRRKLTRILIEANCDRNLRNKQQETAMDIAIRKDLNEIVVILESTKVKKDGKNKKEKEKHDKSKKSRKGSNNKVRFDSNKQWSPYGCHYYPDTSSFPKPKLDSLPTDPLRKGEQYYLDLAGNIRKGPVGVGYTCYCAPLFKHMEERLERDKKELKDHIDQAHAKLGHRVAGLEHRTRGHLQQLTRTAAMERARCERRHRHLEQWLTRGIIGRHSERAPPGVTIHEYPSSTLTRSKSLELLDDGLQRTALPPCKSLDELETGIEQEIYEHGISSHTPTSSRITNRNHSSSAKSDHSIQQTPEPRRTVAEIVAHLQGSGSNSSPNTVPQHYSPSDLQWPAHSPEDHSESSDDEDRPLRLAQECGPMRDSNLALPSYENVGTFGVPNGGIARTRSGLYSPAGRENVGEHLAHLRLLDGDLIDRETNNDSGYSTKVYGSSKGNSPSLSGPLDIDKPPNVQRLGNSSLV